MMWIKVADPDPLHDAPRSIALDDESLAGTILHDASANRNDPPCSRYSRRTDRNLGSIRRLHACLERFLSILVVHRDHRRVSVDLYMEKIIVASDRHDTAHTH